ncbi:MAG: DNA-methyltransferase [Alphaproteobacteria bacterium]
MELDKIYLGNAIEVLKTFPDDSIDCCVTSPPYYALRDYGVEGQIGLEESPQMYIESLANVFIEVKRILKKEGTLWLNIADSYWGGGWRNAQFNEYSGDIQKGSKGTYCGKSMPPLKGKNGIYKPKDLIGIPWMLAFELRNRGYYLRQDIVWHKPNPMPESVTDRCTKSHEYIFLMSKSQKYYFDHEAIQEPANIQNVSNKIRFGGNKYGDNEDLHFQTYSGNEYKPRTKNTKYDGQRPNTMHLRREEGYDDKEYYVRNKRDVWTVNLKPNKEAHFATYPQELIAPCILAGCPKGGIVLDPFIGSGTTGIVANKLGRHYVGIELNPEYVEMAERRISLERSELKLF